MSLPSLIFPLKARGAVLELASWGTDRSTMETCASAQVRRAGQGGNQPPLFGVSDLVAYFMLLFSLGSGAFGQVGVLTILSSSFRYCQ